MAMAMGSSHVRTRTSGLRLIGAPAPAGAEQRAAPDSEAARAKAEERDRRIAAMSRGEAE